MTPPDLLEEKLQELERRFTDSAKEIKELRKRLPPAARREIAEITDEWHGIHYKWWIGTLAGQPVSMATSARPESWPRAFSTPMRMT